MFFIVGQSREHKVFVARLTISAGGSLDFFFFFMVRFIGVSIILELYALMKGKMKTDHECGDSHWVPSIYMIYCCGVSHEV